MSDTSENWGAPSADDTPAAGLPDPHVDPDSPVATGVSTEDLEARRDRELAELRDMLRQQGEVISGLRQQVNGQAPSSAAASPIPDYDHSGCTQCRYNSTAELSRGEENDGTPVTRPGADSALQHVVYGLAHAAESCHAVYVKFGSEIFQLTRGIV